MFSNTSSDTSFVPTDIKTIKSIYHRFQNLLGRGSDTHSNIINDEMLSSRASTVASDDSFITPVSSVGDLMALSPKRNDFSDETSDLLTGPEFDSICDVTMKEIPTTDDMFIDANSLDYLVKCAESNHHSHIDRGKESLFVKFDPLYAKQKLSDGSSTRTESVVDTTECDVGYETGSTVSVLTDNVVTPKHSQSTGAIPSVCGKDKPMQVVPPVVNSEIPKSSSCSGRTPGLMRSVSAILTPTQVATDRLISISGNTPPIAAPRSPRYRNYSSQEFDHLHSLRLILQKQDHEVLQLRQENRDLKNSLKNTELKYSEVIEDLETKVKKLTAERDNYRDKEDKLLQQINDKALSNRKMSIVMEEYEKTISILIEEQQQNKQTSQGTIDKLTSERDQALNHLSNMESSFNDLLSKYERCKSIILETKEREKVYEQNISECKESVKKYEELYENLKQVTSEALAKANETLDTLKKNYTVETTKLSATVKKHEITIASLQESLVQKTRDNEELMRLYDQLITEVH